MEQVAEMMSERGTVTNTALDRILAAQDLMAHGNLGQPTILVLHPSIV